VLRRILLILIVLPVSLGLIALAVANRHDVSLVLDPFARDAALSVSVPLFVLLFASLILGVLLGGMAVWMKQGRFRRAAREAGREARRANAQANELRAIVAASGPTRPGLPATTTANANMPSLTDRRSAA
jgi:uncharacterized membrane protein YciS (DUF1049 family)